VEANPTAFSDDRPIPEDEDSPEDGGASANLAFPSVLHKDTFLIFRALCKLSMKGLQDDGNSQSDPIALQNK
jgi:hypothetical protein